MESREESRGGGSGLGTLSAGDGGAATVAATPVFKGPAIVSAATAPVRGRPAAWGTPKAPWGCSEVTAPPEALCHRDKPTDGMKHSFFLASRGCHPSAVDALALVSHVAKRFQVVCRPPRPAGGH